MTAIRESTTAPLDTLGDWYENERREGTLVAEETLWREAHLAYAPVGRGGPGHRVDAAWAALAGGLVFDRARLPRNEAEAAREAVSYLREAHEPDAREAARCVTDAADRWNVDRSKMLNLLSPGTGYPWMFSRRLWTPATMGAAVEALLAPLAWKPDRALTAESLAADGLLTDPHRFLDALCGGAPEGSRLARAVNALVSLFHDAQAQNKDVSVMEPQSFLAALEYHGFGSADDAPARRDALALRAALVLVLSYRMYASAEWGVQSSAKVRDDDPGRAISKLTRATNVYKRLCVAQMYPERLLGRYQALCREMGHIRRDHGIDDTRLDQVLLVSTMNSPPDLQRLLVSVMHELMAFGYGRRVHVIVSDDSAPPMREQNARLIDEAAQAGLSVSHWDRDRKDRFLQELNREVFPDGECDVGNLAGVRRPGEKGVPYGRFRNFLRLVALQEIKELGLDEPVLTWLDQDNEIGALVLTHTGALAKRHVFDYFDQKSSIFDGDDVLVGGGGYTNDALEGVEKFWVAWGILHQVFDLAQQHAPDDPASYPPQADITRFRPWDQPETLERLRREGEEVETIADQVLLLFSTLLGTFRGKYDNQVQIYHPWTFGYVVPGDEELVEEMRPFAGMPGGNTSFASELLSSPIPFITVGGRGEDILHLWQLEAAHGPGTVRLTHTPALHTRNVRSGRSDLMAEIVDSYNGRIFREPPYLWAALARFGADGKSSGRFDDGALEAETAAHIENLRGEAKANIAAVSGFAAALEPYVDPSADFWWIERAQADPRYAELLSELRGVVEEFKGAERYQHAAEERLLTFEDVKDLTRQFLADYPHWQTVVEHVRGSEVTSRAVGAVPESGPGGYGSARPEVEERRPEFAGAREVDDGVLLEPEEEPPWQEAVDASLSLFRRFESGRAESDTLVSWGERVRRLAELHRHYAAAVGDDPPFLWTRLFRDALLVPHTAPYLAVTELLGDEFQGIGQESRPVAIGDVATRFDVPVDLLEQAARPPEVAAPTA